MSEGKMKILNLYAGIGGNRKLWGDDYEVTAVEYNESISKIYADLYPNDKIILGDAHEYLRLNFEQYDFIWSSPPCQTHSRLNFSGRSRGKEYQYPSMKLYEEIILLQTFFKGKFVIENVKGYYEPLIKPTEIGRHYFWSNFPIKCSLQSSKVRNEKGQTLKSKMEQRNIVINDFRGYVGDKRQLINNCVEPEIGLFILNCAVGDFNKKFETQTLFENEM
jgi:DNA (cytosine-5)-methyltransferase 1